MSLRFVQGQRISCRGEEWQVEDVKSHEGWLPDLPVWEITAKGLSGIVQDQTFCFITSENHEASLDSIEILDPKDIEPIACDKTVIEKAKLYVEASLRHLLPRNGALYLGQHGAIAQKKYQKEPAAQALKRMQPRILIGDAVGLGKTIECGILLSELIRRGKARRVLCAVPKATLEQFQIEMWARFSIPFHRLDSMGLQKLRENLPSTMNPFFHLDKVIISIDTLKISKYQNLLKNTTWDVVVIDECHNVANRTDGGAGSQRHRVAQMLTSPERARSVILMSATPHDGTPEGFSSLIKMLEPWAIAADNQYKLEDVSPLFIRRSRSMVADETGNKKSRISRVNKVEISKSEEEVLSRLHSLKFSYIDQKTNKGSTELFKTSLIKSFLSSPQALIETLEKKIKTLKKRGLASKKIEPEAIENDIESLSQILDLTKNLSSFSRLQALINYLKTNPPMPDDRVVIFTERIATKHLLVKSLIEAGLADQELNLKDPTANKNKRCVATLQGMQMSDREMSDAINAFNNTKDNVPFLVTTNVASEGLNLHYLSHRLIHFDLPWSLITLEQRNGRIDRLGQTKQPEIIYLASFSANKDIYDDFWITEKLEKRTNQAGEDLDDEALRLNFRMGAEEEEKRTKSYEQTGSADLIENKDQDQFDFMAMLMAEQTRPDTYAKKIASLYETPIDFVRQLSQLEKDRLKEKKRQTDSELCFDLNQNLIAEIEQWPHEFQPTQAEGLVLEEDPAKMEAYYEKARNNKQAISRSFLNEIHPVMSHLEKLAQSYFEGKKRPFIRTKFLNQDRIVILAQASLFNQLNEVVFQNWQLIEFDLMKSSHRFLTNRHPIEPDHTFEVTEWLKEAFSQANSGQLRPQEASVMERLADRGLELMKEQASESREKRRNELLDDLKAQKSKIKNWVKNRSIYLHSEIEKSKTETHRGTKTRAKYAETELSQIAQYERQFSEFIQKQLSTIETPELQIIAIFAGERP